ncbi:hypothetical protein DB35_08395 [Streptomyces abyssalis]|uniref:hypothetical protein n=1 Tax=Streptomyces abyssalis TaxID=933944 RepID=UPI00085CD85B|nr:hypothetical protein [Streptomyces abyssalis]OEU94111.1 hypothetical protein DB35_08395 [Streptomyces abyssalis]OEV28953.1 hypothetical protein AN219_19170 [Streptomyces nanshensis]
MPRPLIQGGSRLWRRANPAPALGLRVADDLREVEHGRCGGSEEVEHAGGHGGIPSRRAGAETGVIAASMRLEDVKSPGFPIR